MSFDIGGLVWQQPINEGRRSDCKFQLLLVGTQSLLKTKTLQQIKVVLNHNYFNFKFN